MNPRAFELAVRERLGIDVASLGATVLPRAIEVRLRARGITTPEAYLGVLTSEPCEAQALVTELVVGETWFFRGGRPLFDRLAEFIISRASGRDAEHPVRILSVPCSTGEEPYSLAIALHERMAQPERYQIDAVDVSPRHLERALAAQFSAFAFREAGGDIRPQYFRPQADRWELLPHLRQRIRFRTANLADPAFLVEEPAYDLIMCRNLFIYLTPEARKQAMAALDRLLALDGRLCLTPGEADRLPPGQFAVENPTEFGIYRRVGVGSGVFAIPAAARRPLPAPAPPPEAAPPVPVPTPTQQPLPPAPAPQLQLATLESARALANGGRLLDALSVCEQLVRSGNVTADTYTLLGVIHQALGDSPTATDAFRRALYLNPNHAEALSHMIVLCDRRGDAPQATALRRRLARLPGEEQA